MPQPRWTPDRIAAEIRDLEAAAARHDEALADCARDGNREFGRAAAAVHRQNAREIRETAAALRDGVDPTDLGYSREL